MQPGHGLEFTCDYFNYRDHPITWGADVEHQEHCNMSAYYYPAEDLSQFCFIEKPEVATIVGPAGRIAPNDLMTYTITLNMPAAAGGSVIKLTASNPDAVQLPETV